MKQDKDIKAIVEELSSTLPPILPTKNTEDIWEDAVDFISYNHSYYCNGHWLVTDYNEAITSLHLQSVGEYQVLRLFFEGYYLDGSQYCAHMDSWRDFEDEDGEDIEDAPDLEQIQVETRQIWIDRQGNKVVRVFDDTFDTEVNYVCADALHDWSYEPKVKSAILDAVNENIGYDTKITIGYIMSHEREYLLRHAPQFLKIAEYDSNYIDEIQMYFRTLRIAIRHGLTLPTESNAIRLYFRTLRQMEDMGIDIHNPKHLTSSYMFKMMCNYDKYLRKKEEQRTKQLAEKAKREQEERLARADAFQEQFMEIHKGVTGISFDTEEFHFESLDTARAYVVEGDIMHHCIGKMGYYKKENQISFHITDHEGNRVATCTIDYMRGVVVELQTMCNNPDWRKGEEYQDIKRTMLCRMHIFKQMAEDARKADAEVIEEIKIAI